MVSPTFPAAWFDIRQDDPNYPGAVFWHPPNLKNNVRFDLNVLHNAPSAFFRVKIE